MWSINKGQPILIDTISKKVLKTIPLKAGEDWVEGKPLDGTELRLAFPRLNEKQFEKILINIENDDLTKNQRKNLAKFKAQNIFLENADFIPLIGKLKWDGHIFVCGATGAGKTVIIKKILENDQKRRKIFLITDIETRDPSFGDLFDDRMFMVKNKPDKDKPWEVSIGEFKNKMKGSIVVFDDIQSLENEVGALRNKILEKGRHKNIMAIVVNHQMRDHNRTRSALNESRWIICFPSSNRAIVNRFMKDMMEIPAQQRRNILDVAQQDGRHMSLHLFTPNFIATAKSAMII